MTREAGSIASSDHSERFEPQILRAAESDDVVRLREIVSLARERDQLTDNLLTIALRRSSEKGKVSAATFLLQEGAKPDDGDPNRLSPLLKAVERAPPNQIAIVKVLLKYEADPESRGKKGRTALMTACWKGLYHVVELLIRSGADVNGTDLRQRNVLHNLGADTSKSQEWGDSVVELLLKEDIHIDVKDQLGRTPLHWACVSGKRPLAEMLLNRPQQLKANINAVEIRGKTSLHLACSHDRDDMVELLLLHGADVNARSDGGWTPLHNACEKGCLKNVEILLEAGASVNERLLNGATPLHLAAQGAHIDVVKCLLQNVVIKKAPRDSFGMTPFLRAAQSHAGNPCLELLAPYNHLESLSDDAVGACKGFNATIVDFGNFRNENRVEKISIYELLYGRDKQNPRRPAFSILPKDDKGKGPTDFRWIHLPANNIKWVETLLTKLFIEEGASDVLGFQQLEKSFSHQHRGKETHSHFMRPLCQSISRATKVSKVTGTEAKKPANSLQLPAIAINGQSMLRTSSSTSAVLTKGAPYEERRKIWPKEGGGGHADRGKAASKNQKDNKKSKIQRTSESEAFESRPNNPHQPVSHIPHAVSTHTPARSNIFTFFPYLHFENSGKIQEMQDAIKRAEEYPNSFFARPPTADEMLVRAHLTSSSVSLHVRRTLDQSYFHNINTAIRDVDQVVYRYQLQTHPQDGMPCDPKIFMVDQCWMWVLDKTIITSFPQRWQQPKNDPLNVLDSLIEDINSKIREPAKSVYDVAMLVTARCTGLFDRHRLGDDAYQFLDMFESSIGIAHDKETSLFREFNTASRQASTWLQQHQKSSRIRRVLTNRGKRTTANDLELEELLHVPLFVDKLLDIGQETDLLAEVKDQRDELNMIRKVLEDQQQVLPDLEAAICEIYAAELPAKSQTELKKRSKDQLKLVEMHLKDIDRMDRQAERIYLSVTDMLDLKQKHANAFEARFARDQAKDTNRQSQIIMVFTIVTIIFLPLSFIAAFFTINIQEFPGSNADSGGGVNNGLPLAYVSKYMFGIGFAISIPLVLIALSLDNIAYSFAWARQKMAKSRDRREQERRDKEATSSLMGGIGLYSEAGSRTRAEDTWSLNIELGRLRDTRPSRETVRTGGKIERQPITAFKMLKGRQ